ncbi:MAG: asparagine synthetase B, partial [Verrucomicrobia bacterium]|nr:asparagine synthetase B [Verrucomicrobiota bacterium]
MCGILASFHPRRGELDQSVYIKMRDRMSHRGPDGAGLWVSSDRTCLLAHRRLSIIDLSDTAAQPMVCPRGDVALVFNGEIYNHDELRRELRQRGRQNWQTDHSDTEVLLQAYEEWGMDCLNRLHGDFAFAVFDGRRPGRP